MDSIWLYLEPFTFISEDETHFLFYNSRDKKNLSIVKKGKVKNVIKQLMDVDQLYSVKIEIKDLEDEVLFHFVEIIQSSGYGDIIDGDSEKPIIFPPLLNLQQDGERLREHDAPFGWNILSYLHEALFYINGVCSLDCTDCQDTMRQCAYCTKSNDILNFDALKNFLFSISHSKASIVLLGGNVFLYPELDALMSLLDEMDNPYTLVSDWRNIPTSDVLTQLSSYKSLHLRILHKGAYDREQVWKVAKEIEACYLDQSWEFLVSSEEEYEKASLLEERLGDFAKVWIKPFYNGQNEAFFESYVYTDQDELKSIALTRQNIFALQALNTNDFGKITIMSDGSVYANVNEKPLGTIQDPIKDLLCKELESKNTWRRTRYDLEPCSHCRFKLICPSPSNYERVIGKNNLCHILK